jgi:hypothetical protein
VGDLVAEVTNPGAYQDGAIVDVSIKVWNNTSDAVVGFLLRHELSGGWAGIESQIVGRETPFYADDLVFTETILPNSSLPLVLRFTAQGPTTCTVSVRTASNFWQDTVVEFTGV